MSAIPCCVETYLGWLFLQLTCAGIQKGNSRRGFTVIIAVISAAGAMSTQCWLGAVLCWKGGITPAQFLLMGLQVRFRV